MRSIALVAALCAALTLALPGCGGGKTGDSKSSGATKSAPTSSSGSTASGAAASAAGEADGDAASAEGSSGDEPLREAMVVLEDLPSQDDLDAAAAARISAETADAEYERLKAEIEADLAEPVEPVEPVEDG